MKGKNVIVGLTGGIAVYKAAHLVRELRRRESSVKVIMTQAAAEFVAPLTFQTLTNSLVYLEMFDPIRKDVVEHIDLAQWCDVFVVAPATANTIGKMAAGIADNLLTTVILALPHKTPVVIAPAMNTNMWENPIMKKNVESLKKIFIKARFPKYHFVPPRKGALACGDVGEGALASIEDVLNVVEVCVR